MARVIGALGGESAFVCVAVVELSEKHGRTSWRRGKEARPCPPRSPAASVSRAAALPFKFCGLNVVHRLQVRPCWGGVRFASRRAAASTIFRRAKNRGALIRPWKPSAENFQAQFFGRCLLWRIAAGNRQGFHWHKGC